ncbi:SRPBCC family protein [Paenibacillus sp. LHD-117]|uniref:SRPBCC family protein n=1 Tax=Paenibacillus sp. LHD-117 TaxID=3071412 RepID=UPI0027DF3016|nr:SRPBCC family protein [Paenibacillus sp. LHD-117]MDQ6423338.1 SRPBCC family protein [Paenibacillus sp. LHD-117]
MEHKFITYIGADQEKVWNTLIQPEGTRSIFFGSVFQTDLLPGSKFAYIGPGNDGEETVHVYGEIIEIDPGRMMQVIEHPGPSYYENHAELTSRITYTLEPAGECTKLTLVNDRFTENHPSFERSEDSWAIILSNLKTLCETGRTLNFGW